MTYEPPRVIRAEERGPVVRSFYRCACGYRPDKLSLAHGEVWKGATCPKCSKRLVVAHTETH